MTRPAVLDPIEHRALRIDPAPSLAKGDGQRAVEVVISEFPRLAAQYPILVVRDARNGRLSPVAVMGLDEGENLFLDEGGAYQGYRPLGLERQPFLVVEGRLGADLDSPRLGALGGEPLFDEVGEPSAAQARGRSALEALHSGFAPTSAFIEDLKRLELLAPVDIELRFDAGGERRLQGAYAVAQDRLRALPDAAVVEQFRRGHLYLIDLMIHSMRRVADLAARKTRRLQAAG